MSIFLRNHLFFYSFSLTMGCILHMVGVHNFLANLIMSSIMDVFVQSSIIDDNVQNSGIFPRVRIPTS